jgi:hypothetical protein
MALITVTAEPVVDPQTPTVTHYQERANEFIKALDQISVVVPQVDRARFVIAKITRGQLRIPDQFCATAIAGVEQIIALRGGSLDPAVGRDALQRLEAFRPVLDQVGAFYDNLKLMLVLTKAIVSVPSLQMYQYAKRLLKDNPTPELKALVENLKRDLDLRRQTKAEKEEKKALAAFKAAAGDAQKKEVPKAA